MHISVSLRKVEKHERDFTKGEYLSLFIHHDCQAGYLVLNQLSTLEKQFRMLF